MGTTLLVTLWGAKLSMMNRGPQFPRSHDESWALSHDESWALSGMGYRYVSGIKPLLSCGFAALANAARAIRTPSGPPYGRPSSEALRARQAAAWGLGQRPR
jgi:hypothetical protein